MIGNTMRARRTLICVTALLAGSALVACRGGDRNAEPPDGGALGPAPSPLPTPGTTPQYTATPVPFDLAQSRTFDIWGWDSWPTAPTPSAIQFRWNAASGRYEVLAPGYAEWSRLEALQSPFGYPPSDYHVFGSGGTTLPFYMVVRAPSHQLPLSTGRHVGNARIFGSGARAYFAFGIATAQGDVPVSGTMTCSFAEDEIGVGELTFDFAAGTASGWAEPFWVNVRYPFQTSFEAGATTFAAAFGTDGVLEGRFFGPGAANVAIRAKGGGQRLAGVNGILNGECAR